MAWIVKNSGTMKIARRPEPWVTEVMQQRYRAELLPKYETSQGALMPILHDVQHAYGWILGLTAGRVKRAGGIRPTS